MKSPATITILLIACSFASCTDGTLFYDLGSNDKKLRGPVKSLNESCYKPGKTSDSLTLSLDQSELFDTSGKLVYSTYMGLIADTSVYLYDQNGAHTETRIVYGPGQLPREVTFKYDKRGGTQIYSDKNIWYVDSIETTNDGKNKTRLTYDGGGELLVREKFDDKDNIISSTDYHYNRKNAYIYDSNKNRIEEKRSNRLGIPYGRLVRKYNSNNCLTNIILYNGWGNIICKKAFDYDSLGNKKKIIEYIEKPKQTITLIYTYTYDKFGNWLTKTQYENGKATEITKRIIEYH